MISIVIPSHNNLRHLKNAYESIKKHAPQAEIILYDDASTDGTWGWMLKTATVDRNCKILKSDVRVGHTVLYEFDDLDNIIQAKDNTITTLPN